MPGAGGHGAAMPSAGGHGAAMPSASGSDVESAIDSTMDESPDAALHKLSATYKDNDVNISRARKLLATMYDEKHDLHQRKLAAHRKAERCKTPLAATTRDRLIMQYEQALAVDTTVPGSIYSFRLEAGIDAHVIIIKCENFARAIIKAKLEYLNRVLPCESIYGGKTFAEIIDNYKEYEAQHYTHTIIRELQPTFRGLFTDIGIFVLPDMVVSYANVASLLAHQHVKGCLVMTFRKPAASP
jgi:hypothetical protein